MRRRLFHFARVFSLALFVALCGVYVVSLFTEFGILRSDSVETDLRSFSRGWYGVSFARGRIVYTRTASFGEDDYLFRNERLKWERWKTDGLRDLYGHLAAEPTSFTAWSLIGVRFHVWRPPTTAWSEVDQVSGSLLPAILLSAVLPALWANRYRIRLAQERRRKRGLCAHCGFDLRASPGRCPECGIVPAATPDAAASPADAVNQAGG